ncbi:MAG: PHB depolymerase family esterase [Polyangiaceae bacterium]
MARIGTFAQASLLVAVFATRPATAASLQKVDRGAWGVNGLPLYVNMYVYVPDKLAAKPPVLVASHHCQGTGTTTYNETKSTFVALADKNGFIIIFPEATGHNCWDVGSAKSLEHDGGGDTHAIAQMVRYTLKRYNGDATRVYAFGGSSGAMMTQALLGIYPEIFAAGVAVSGVPCGCWAVDYSGDVATNGQWSGPCAGGKVSKTAQQWGDQVRSMFPGYTGHRPRVQLWHGTADTVISFANFGEAIKEWTNLLGLNAAPNTTDAKFGGTHQLWKSTCGYGVLETFAVTDAGHGVNWDSNTAVAFLSLDKVGVQDPEAVACPGSGGMSGVGGASSVGGGSASGGTSAATGAGGRSSASGGQSGKGGSSSAASDTAGHAGAGASAFAVGGASVSAGAGGIQDTHAGASSASGGRSSDWGSGRTSASAGQADVYGLGGASSVAVSEDGTPDGCSCIVPGSHRKAAGVGTSLLLGALGLLSCRGRRRRC